MTLPIRFLLLVIGMLLSACQTALPVVTGTPDNITAEVRVPDMVVLTEFGADWCGFCKDMKPVYAELLDKYPGTFKVITIDVDKYGLPAGVDGIPFFILSINGKILTVGHATPDMLRDWVDQAMDMLKTGDRSKKFLQWQEQQPKEPQQL